MNFEEQEIWYHKNRVKKYNTYLKLVQKLMKKMEEIQRMCWDLEEIENENYDIDSDVCEKYFGYLDDKLFNRQEYMRLFDISLEYVKHINFSLKWLKDRGIKWKE